MPDTADNTVTPDVMERLAKGSIEVPLLPQVASQVMAICNDPDCEVRDLMETIKQDQALMAHVMRMANSALYAPDVPIVSLQLAVNRLGLSTVRDLAVAAACRGAVFKAGAARKLVNNLFKRAMARAVFAQEVARMRRSNVEVAFLAGMMAEIGAPVIVHEVSRSGGSEADMVELIERYHQTVSVIVLEAWEMPDKLVESVRYSHDPEEAGDLSDLIYTVKLADFFAERILEQGDGEPTTVLDDCCIALNLFADDVDRLSDKGDDILAMVGALG